MVHQMWRMMPAPSRSQRTTFWPAPMLAKSALPPARSQLEARRRRPWRARARSARELPRVIGCHFLPGELAHKFPPCGGSGGRAGATSPPAPAPGRRSGAAPSPPVRPGTPIRGAPGPRLPGPLPPAWHGWACRSADPSRRRPGTPAAWCRHPG